MLTMLSDMNEKVLYGDGSRCDGCAGKCLYLLRHGDSLCGNKKRKTVHIPSVGDLGTRRRVGYIKIQLGG